MPDIGYLGAALAGFLAFFSPCILPMVPFYLAYMSGLSMSELRGDGTVATGAQRRLVALAMAFALGVTAVFILLGLGATALGRAFADYREPLGYLAAVVLFVFGLHFLGALRIPLLYREARIDAVTKPRSILGAFVMGLAFGFGWTPCVGPALAAILLIASRGDNLWHGASLLMVFGLAMTLPFVLAAFFAKPFLAWVGRHRGLFKYVEKAMGVMLILFALLIATGSVNRIGQWMIETFDWSATII